MKYIIVFVGIILIIISAFLFLIFSPYFIYFKAINQGISYSFITIGPKMPGMLKASEFQIKKVDEFLAQNERRWKSFHFANYKIPLPLEHPTLELIPDIEKRLGKVHFGGGLIDKKNYAKFKFLAGSELDFDYHLNEQKLFNLPIFREDLERIPRNKLFKVIFSHDVNLKKLDKSSKLNYFKSLWNIPYQNLVFNLFVLHSRNKFFPKDTVKFSYYPEREMGIAQTKDDNPIYYQETVFILRDDKMHTFHWRLPKGDLLADSIRTRFLKTINFEKSYEDKRIEAYNDFRILPYKKKIGSVGFTYLYVGFTHVPLDQVYFKAMIRDLEKRPGNARILQPFYEYGKETFKIEKKKSWQKKVEEEKVSEGLNEEDKKILKEVSKEIKNVEIDESTLSKEEKIDFYLEDAKKDGGGIEGEEGVLEMD